MLHRIGVEVESEISPSCVGSKTRSATYPQTVWMGLWMGPQLRLFFVENLKYLNVASKYLLSVQCSVDKWMYYCVH